MYLCIPLPVLPYSRVPPYWAPQAQRAIWQPLARGLSTPRALKVKVKEISKKLLGREIDVFPTDLHRIWHARSCSHFLWFPHTPKPPRPLKRPKDFNLLFEFLQLFSFLLSSARLGYGYTSRAGAIVHPRPGGGSLEAQRSSTAPEHQGSCLAGWDGERWNSIQNARDASR